jgi:general secretion pathway protein D
MKNTLNGAWMRKILFGILISFTSAFISAQELKENETKLTFVGADIESVIKAVGHYTGKTFIIDPRVKGTINLVSEQPISKAQAFELLTSTLRLQGYAVVSANGFVKVVPESDGKLQAGPTQTLGIKGDQIMTQVFHLNYESAGNVATVLRPLISPNNTINANPGNNTVVITDYADNVKRLAKIIATLDAPNTNGVEIIQLKYGIATDVVALLLRLTEQNTVGMDSGKMTILADSRINAILLNAPTDGRANLVKTLIQKLDQPTALPGNVHVVYLRNADAVKLAQTLRAIVSLDSNSTSSPTNPTQTVNTPQNQLTAPRSLASNTGASNSSGLGNALGSSSSTTSNNASNNVLPAGGQAGYIQADSATNTLIITANETLYRNLRAVIDQLDSRRAQVYIEALIIEVSTKKAEQFGVQWAGITGNSNSDYRVGLATAFDTGGKSNNLFNLAAAGKSAVPNPGINLGVFSSRFGLGAIASALQSSGNANVLSVPTLTTLDNEEAKMLVGKNVPFITGQYSNSTSNSGSTVNPFQTIERKDVGVTLRVRPQISEGGSVKLTIYQEVSTVDDTSNQAGIITNIRAIETNVIVDDGQILVLGGLMAEDSSDTEDRVPLLGDIPYLGYLFKYKTQKRDKSNLLIFLRPTVIRNPEQSTAVSMDRYDYMRAKSVVTKSDGASTHSLLNVPSLSPNKGDILLPQDVFNRASTPTKLDVTPPSPASGGDERGEGGESKE